MTFEAWYRQNHQHDSTLTGAIHREMTRRAWSAALEEAARIAERKRLVSNASLEWLEGYDAASKSIASHIRAAQGEAGREA